MLQDIRNSKDENKIKQNQFFLNHVRYFITHLMIKLEHNPRDI